MTATATISTMPARFASTCAACGQRIRAGSAIARHRQVRQYVHVECVDIPEHTVRAGRARNQVRQHQAREERRTERLQRASGSAARRWVVPRAPACRGSRAGAPPPPRWPLVGTER